MTPRNHNESTAQARTRRSRAARRVRGEGTGPAHRPAAARGEVARSRPPVSRTLAEGEPSCEDADLPTRH